MRFGCWPQLRRNSKDSIIESDLSIDSPGDHDHDGKDSTTESDLLNGRGDHDYDHYRRIGPSEGPISVFIGRIGPSEGPITLFIKLP